MKKIAKDPAQKLLNAYYSILNGAIIYDGTPVTISTHADPDADKYVHIYIEDISPMHTGDSVIYNALVVLEIVSMQETTESDETIVNSIFEQTIELVEDTALFVVNGFKVLTSMFQNSDQEDELTDTNYILTRKLRMSNIIEQI